MPTYVRRGGLDVAPPPWQCDDIHATVFYVLADPAQLQALCDRTLNQPSGPDPAKPGQTRLKYTPLVNWVALTFQTFHGMRSTAPLDTASLVRERHDYSEAAFWVMVADADGVRVMIPYMFIDDGTLMAAGREGYGFPKELARLDIPSPHDPDQRVFGIEALAVSPGAVAAVMQPILQCRRVAPPGVADEIVAVTKVTAAMGALLTLFVGATLPFVFLRQFRALAGGTGADLQQVTAAEARPFRFDILRIKPLIDFELLLPHLTSHPIASDFGFAAGPVAVPFGFQCKLAFTLNPGRVL